MEVDFSVDCETHCCFLFCILTNRILQATADLSGKCWAEISLKLRRFARALRSRSSFSGDQKQGFLGCKELKRLDGPDDVGGPGGISM